MNLLTTYRSGITMYSYQISFITDYRLYADFDIIFLESQYQSEIIVSNG